MAVRYIVHNVDEAISFYKRLGFFVDQQFGPAMAVLVRGGMTLWLAGP
jgi:predicted lactoylglutathione lyase